MIKKIALCLASIFAVLFFMSEKGTLKNTEVELVSASTPIYHDTDIVSLMNSSDSGLPGRIFGDKPGSYKFSMDIQAFNQQIHKDDDVTEQPLTKIGLTGSLLLQAQHQGSKSESTRIFVKLAELNTHTGNDNNSEQELGEKWAGFDALEIPFAFDLDSQGKIKLLHLSSNEDDFSAGIKRVIAARMQFTTDNSGKSNWQVEEIDETGLHLVDYHKESNVKFSKSVIRYIQLAHVEDSKTAHSIREHHGKSSYQFESSGLLYSIDSLSDVSASMQGINIRSNTRYNIEWAGFNNHQVVFDMTADYKSFPPNVIASFSKQDRKNLEPIDLYDFVAQLNGMDPDRDFEQRWKLRDRFIESVKNDPSILADVSAMIANNLSERNVTFLIGALTDAGTSESQQALMEVSSDLSLPLEVRHQALTHIGLVNAPTQEAVEYLSKVGNDETLAPDLREPALLALGNSVRSGLQEENKTDHSASPAVYEEAVRALEEGFEGASELGESHAYVAALGNAGSQSSSDLLLELASSENDFKRQMGVDALRFVDDPRVDSTLIDIMQNDSSVNVQIDAIKTTIYRDSSPELNENLFSVVRESDEPQVRIAALESLGFRVPDSEALLQEMRYRSLYDEHEMVREFAQSAVEAYESASMTSSD